MSDFSGFPAGLFEFFADLSRDNSKSFWNANRGRWQQDVKTPMAALIEELSADFGPLRMFRPNRDPRFTTDSSPYKLWTGATSTPDATGGIGYYLSVSATSITTGYGAMRMSSDQLHRFRTAIDHDTSGAEFEDLTTILAAKGLPITPGADSPLKRAPRGFHPTHPRIDFLKWKGAAVIREWPTAAWMQTPHAIEEIRTTWSAATPLKSWLSQHVSTPTADYN